MAMPLVVHIGAFTNLPAGVPRMSWFRRLETTPAGP